MAFLPGKVRDGVALLNETQEALKKLRADHEHTVEALRRKMTEVERLRTALVEIVNMPWVGVVDSRDYNKVCAVARRALAGED